MPVQNLTTIAQLLCLEDLPINFAKMVGDFDSVLERLRLTTRKTRWDSDDVATIDLPGMRVLLGWSECPSHNLAGILTISVGPSPLDWKSGQKNEVISIDPKALCKRLVSRAQKRVPAADVLWHQIDCIMDAEWVELLIDALPDKAAAGLSGAMMDLPSNERFARRQRPVVVMGALQPKRASGAANEIHRPLPATVIPIKPQVALKTWDEADLARLRIALYAKEDETYTTQMRLAVHAMNATLIIVWMPLGVAAMVHGMVKGEDMRLASRLMVAAGSFAALAQTPFGMQMVALASL